MAKNNFREIAKRIEKMLNEKDRPIVRECDWCGEVKLLHLLEGTHYTICIDCAAMDFILNQRNKESR